MRPSIPQIGFADALVLRGSRRPRPPSRWAGLDQIGVVGEVERELGVLLDDQHADALLGG